MQDRMSIIFEMNNMFKYIALEYINKEFHFLGIGPTFEVYGSPTVQDKWLCFATVLYVST